MRLLILHDPPNESSLSGEQIAVIEGAEALARYGYDIEWLDWNTNNAPLGQKEIEKQISSKQIDVVLIEKWFPRGTLIRKLSVASVYRVHNFMPICIAGTLSRDNRICTDCTIGIGSSSIRHRCYRSSIGWSLAANTVHQFQRRQGLLIHADRVAFPSRRALALFTQAIPDLRSRSAVVPSFVPDLERPSDASERAGYFLFAGQLEEYKGVRALLELWPSNLKLRIAGSGSLQALVERYAQQMNIEYLGRLSPSDVRMQMSKASALIFLSSTPETFGRVHAEACSVGTPTIALQGSAVADEVMSAGSGVVVDTIEQLVASAHDSVLPSVTHIRSEYEKRYTEEIWAPAMSDEILEAQHTHRNAREKKA